MTIEHLKCGQWDSRTAFLIKFEFKFDYPHVVSGTLLNSATLNAPFQPGAATAASLPGTWLSRSPHISPGSVSAVCLAAYL